MIDAKIRLHYSKGKKHDQTEKENSWAEERRRVGVR